MLCPSVTPLFSHPFLWIFVLNDVCPTPSHCVPAPLGCATEDGQPQPCLRPSQPGPLDTFRTAGPGCAARATAPLLCRCVSQLCLCEDAGKESGRGRALAALPGAHRVAAGGRRPIPHRRCAGKAQGLCHRWPERPPPRGVRWPLAQALLITFPGWRWLQEERPCLLHLSAQPGRSGRQAELSAISLLVSTPSILPRGPSSPGAELVTEETGPGGFCKPGQAP